MRRFLSFIVIYAIWMFAIHLWLDYSYPSSIEAQSGRTFYVDISATGCGGSGCSNANNGTSEATAWKSVPGMQTGAGCGGATHSYTPAGGDQFIFKGGVTWPAACFGMFLNFGGSASAQNYYGTCGGQSTQPAACGGVTWPSSGWTRPLWDLNHSIPAGDVVVDAESGNTGFMTFDNIEIARQGLVLANGESNDTDVAFEFFFGAQGTILENMYIHDWSSTATINSSVCSATCVNYNAGGIMGSAHIADPTSNAQGIRLINSTISGQNSYFFNGGNKITIGYGGGCRDCYEVGNDTYSYTQAGCFDTYLCHDTEFHDIDDGNVGLYDTTLHSQIVEDDAGGNSVNYNLFIHDSPHAAVGVLICAGSPLYNSVIQGVTNNYAVLIDTNGCQSPASATENLYNNTIDCTTNGLCIRLSPRGGDVIGTVNAKNNILIPSGTIVIGPGTVTNQNFANYPMSANEANAHGYVLTNKYSPSSVDTGTSGTGANLTSSCSGNLAQLCRDTSGAPWFGGSAKSRPTGSTGWDYGAFQGQGGTTGPPTLSITSPSAGSVSGSVNLQSTCTPQGAATCTSVQYFIDGFKFGAAQTSSPYTLAWNTATAANANHVIGATATDSNNQTGSAGTVTVAVSNSIPGCFVSTDNTGQTPLSWTANQSIGTQSANFTLTVTLTPNTTGANQDSVTALSQAVMSAFSQGSALIRFNSSTNTDGSGFTGNIDVYKGSISNYAADNLVTYSASTVYTFLITVNLTGPNAGTYSVAETSPSSVTLATNYAFRGTAPTSLGFINAVSDNTTPDTEKVCNVQVGGGTSLTFSPPSLNFGNVNSGSNASLSVTVTSAGGTTAFSSITVAGTGFSKTADTCSTNTVSNCSFTVKFAPSSTGNFSGTATLVDSATGSPQVVNLSGTGIAAASSATPSPTSINFGNVQLGLAGGATSGPVTMTLINGPVTFSTPAVTYDNPDFSTASITCSGSISAPSCQITPKFIPSSLSNETATMTIHDDAPTGGSTQTVALVGTGVNFPTPAPATMFVFNVTLPITMTMGKKTVTESYPAVCTCNLVVAQWSCSCQ